MIRSLVTAPPASASEEFTLRRNLPQDRLENASNEGDLLWIDVVDPDKDEIDWVGRAFKLSASVMEDLHRADVRPSLMVYPNYIFLSLFEPSLKQLKVEASEIHCIIGDNFMVTVRSEKSKSIEAAYDRATLDDLVWQRGLSYFLYLTCQQVIDSYYPLLDRISNQLNRYEERLILGGKDKVSRQPIYNIKQQLITLRQMIAPQREVIANMLGELRLADEDVRDLFRHLYERLLRVYDLIDAQRDLSSNVLDMMDNMESKRMVDAVNRLTIFSMIFLPLTFFAGLFELNLFDIPQPITLPFPASTLSATMLALMLISAGGIYLLLKRRGLL
jgi:magnesium transporter